MKQYITGIHHIGIPTTDIRRTISFYKKLGADILIEKTVMENAKPCRVSILQLANTIVEIYEVEIIEGKTGAIDHVAFDVNDIEKAFETAGELGLKFVTDGIQFSLNWTKKLMYFIVEGCNGEKIEFSQEE
jgi:lactoylglutathione lyase